MLFCLIFYAGVIFFINIPAPYLVVNLQLDGSLMKQKRKILIFCMIIVGSNVFGQQNSQFHRSLLNSKQPFFQTGSIFQQKQIGKVLPANFYCTQLGFFCKKELKFESATKIPFRFRLGSLQYNDWLEGKKNAGILPAN